MLSVYFPCWSLNLDGPQFPHLSNGDHQCCPCRGFAPLWHTVWLTQERPPSSLNGRTHPRHGPRVLWPSPLTAISMFLDPKPQQQWPLVTPLLMLLLSLDAFSALLVNSHLSFKMKSKWFLLQEALPPATPPPLPFSPGSHSPLLDSAETPCSGALGCDALGD